MVSERDCRIIIDENPGKAFTEPFMVVFIQMRNNFLYGFMQAQNDITPGNSMLSRLLRSTSWRIFFCPVKWVALFALGKPGLSKGIDIQAL